MQKNNEISQENEHIKFWENFLNDLIKQFEILIQFIEINEKNKIQRSSDLIDLLNKYRNDSKQFTKEPSHIYYLCEIFFDFQYSEWVIVNKPTNELYNKINTLCIDIFNS